MQFIFEKSVVFFLNFQNSIFNFFLILMPHRKGGNINKRVLRPISTEHPSHRESAPRTNQTPNTDSVNDKIVNHQNHPEMQVEIMKRNFLTNDLQVYEENELLAHFYTEFFPWYMQTSDLIFKTDEVDTCEIPDNEKDILKVLGNISNKQITLIYVVIGKLIITIFPQIIQTTDTPLTKKQEKQLLELLFPFNNSPIKYETAIEVVSLCIQFFCLNNKTKFRNRIDGLINHPKHLTDSNGNFHDNFTISILKILKSFKMTYLGHYTTMALSPYLQGISKPMDCSIN